MQPYFLPYLGYFQLIGCVDRFVVYDDVEFTKKGWIHRNRFLLQGEPRGFTVNLRADSDFLPVNRRTIAPEFRKSRHRVLRQIRESYGRCEGFDWAYPLVERCFLCDEENLFEFLHSSIRGVRDDLGLGTEVVISSSLGIAPGLRGKERIWAICQALNANEYVNPEGGEKLYDRAAFRERSVELRFLRHRPREYAQPAAAFVPRLSIVDAMLCNPRERMARLLGDFVLE